MLGGLARSAANREAAGAGGERVGAGLRRRLTVASAGAMVLAVTACSSPDTVTSPAARTTESVDPSTTSAPMTAPSASPTPSVTPSVPRPTVRPLRERQAAAAAKAAAEAAQVRTAQQRRAAAQRRAVRDRQLRAVRRAAAARARRPVPQPPTTAPPTPATSGLSGPAAEVLRLVNVQRAGAGCTALVNNAVLTRVALAHSSDMALHGYFAHDSQDGRSPFDRIRAAGYRGTTMGENIAAGQPTAAAVMAAWMKSPGHRANILNCAYREIGIGYHAGGSLRHYWTQDFGTR